MPVGYDQQGNLPDVEFGEQREDTVELSGVRGGHVVNGDQQMAFNHGSRADWVAALRPRPLPREVEAHANRACGRKE